MGLDMYLTKRTYIGAEYDFREVGGKIDITIKGEPVNINFNRVQTIIEKVGYWRKSNQIHNWFVQNVQDGEDDCKEYRVSREQFQSLLDDVNAVLSARDTPEEKGAIEDLLPPTSGFFFGSNEIDDWYWGDVENTEHLIESVLAEMDEDAKNSESWVDYYYQSSW